MIDVLVIGAGFGGLSAALSLAERGARVTVCEALKYPGGCASTFKRRGCLFEAGATLFSGLAEHQLFGKWIRSYSLPIELDWLDPVVEMRMPAFSLDVPLSREELIRRFCAMPGAPQEQLAGFFELQRKVADALWYLFDDPEMLPPIGFRSLGRHLLHSPRLLPLLPWLGRPMGDVLVDKGLAGFQPLWHYLNAVCQITVQCGVASAEAAFAFAACDYFFRGTAHVRGGIGVLARGLCTAIEKSGGNVVFSNAVHAVSKEKNYYRIAIRKGDILARSIVCNLLPQNIKRLFSLRDGECPALDSIARDIEDGWGAAMLYAVLRPPAQAGEQPHHLELVERDGEDFIEGNHLFASMSGANDIGRAGAGLRTMTVSTHLPMKKLLGLPEQARGEYIEAVQARMKRVFALRAPEWNAGIESMETASPRTFERFTGRFNGYVGGIPRRAGLHHYTKVFPSEPMPGVWMVGDSVFPGQSTLATALGGVRVASAVSF